MLGTRINGGKRSSAPLLGPSLPGAGLTLGEHSLLQSKLGAQPFGLSEVSVRALPPLSSPPENQPPLPVKPELPALAKKQTNKKNLEEMLRSHNIPNRALANDFFPLARGCLVKGSVAKTLSLAVKRSAVRIPSTRGLD